MTKRDRIAIVVSVGWWLLMCYIYGSIFKEEIYTIFMVPVAIYWAYRFIKKGE